MLYAEDLQILLASRHGNGADFWASPDRRVALERPVSTVTALFVLPELGVSPDHEAVVGAAEQVLANARPDGRIGSAPGGTVLPCSVAAAAAALCRNGYAGEERVIAALEWLRTHRHTDGGWRCAKFFFGRGPETEFSNPGVTLAALDAFRFTGLPATGELDDAVETLLTHWTVRAPTGPCHYGIGTQFMQVEYPMLRYNLFNYVYVLSFYARAKNDPRFREAFAALDAKRDADGRMIVERPNRKFAGMSICRPGQASEAATARFNEIRERLGNG